MIGTASAPASSGNLGPGFDTLALALELRCTVEAEPASMTVVVGDDGTQVAPRRGEIVAEAVAAVGPPMTLRIHSEIPQRRGLGSSAAVAAATAAAAIRATGGSVDRHRIFTLVAALEGHGDNAAAAVFGGLQAACVESARALEFHAGLMPLVAVPDVELRTDDARVALPATFPTEVVARTIARAVFLVEGLRTGDPGAFRHARGDEIHEAPRAALSPVTTRLVEAALDAGAVHAAWSGAGPSALALVTAETAAAVETALATVLGATGVVRRLPVDAEGLR